jgi:hypothetical protein
MWPDVNNGDMAKRFPGCDGSGGGPHKVGKAGTPALVVPAVRGIEPILPVLEAISARFSCHATWTASKSEQSHWGCQTSRTTLLSLRPTASPGLAYTATFMFDAWRANNFLKPYVSGHRKKCDAIIRLALDSVSSQSSLIKRAATHFSIRIIIGIIRCRRIRGSSFLRAR